MKALAKSGDAVADPTGAPSVSETGGNVDLLDATRITYRPVRPQDAAALRRFHRRLSEHSIHLRFFGAKPELSARKAGYFTNVDGVNSFALVALDPDDPDEIIAIVSFFREGSTDRAEYAAAVEDRWQGRGLGLALTRVLIAAALRRNVRVFTGMVLLENARMLNLLRDLKLPERLRYEDGVEVVEIELLPENLAAAHEENRRKGSKR
jgi:GNAT superfamily N-acetyltransferase